MGFLNSSLRDKFLTRSLAKDHGSGSFILGALGMGSKKRKDFVRKALVEPIIATDIALGKKAIGVGSNVGAFANKFLPRKAADWVGNLPKKFFSRNIPIHLTKNITRRMNVPALSTPLSRLRGLAIPVLTMVGTGTVLDAISKRYERKKAEKEWINSIEGGTNEQY